MSNESQNQQTRLEADIEHLREEIASIELAAAHATGRELEQMHNEQRELRETMQSKQRMLEALTQEKGGSAQ